MRSRNPGIHHRKLGENPYPPAHAGPECHLRRYPSAGLQQRLSDDFATLAAAWANPETLLAEDAILDEVQRCPELLLSLKRRVDEQRRPGRFVLSSSANLALLSQVSDTLPGRAVYFTLYPMARREIQGQTGQPLFLVEFIRSQAVPRGAVEPVSDRKVLTGGLPPACLGPAEAIGEQGSRMKLQGKAKLRKVQ